MNPKSIDYKHRLAYRLLEVLNDIRPIDKQLALSMPVEDLIELGKLLVPAQEKIAELRKKEVSFNAHFEHRKRRIMG